MRRAFGSLLLSAFLLVFPTRYGNIDLALAQSLDRRIEVIGPLDARVTDPSAHSIRLHFASTTIPPHVQLRITGEDGLAQQVLDAVGLAEWGGTSAYFNGPTVEVHIEAESGVAPPAAIDLLQDLTIEIDPTSSLAAQDETPPQIIIGTDDRVHSNNPASGRIDPVGCTGWLLSSGLALSAGHCFKKVSGQQILEFDVPPSAYNGSIRHPPPEKQFPINMNSAIWRSDDLKIATGNDWAVFKVGRNGKTFRSVFSRCRANSTGRAM